MVVKGLQGNSPVKSAWRADASTFCLPLALWSHPYFAATTAAIINEAFCPLFVPLRASPTMGSVSVTQFDADSLSNATVTPTVNSFNANRQLVLNFTGLNADLLDNRACFIRINAPLTMNAEL